MRNVNQVTATVYGFASIGFILTMRNVNSVNGVITKRNMYSFILTMRNVNQFLSKGVEIVVKVLY
ncbi:TPA: hypothetical protein I9064_001192 [Clostridium perfringens]|nr:hypothetical protein [Clostridium perfringens]